MPKHPIHIFRAGSHTAMQGQTIAFGEADLAASAAAYDPAKHEAPIVVGHPAADAPAFGWVQSLAAEGGDLNAMPRQVDPAFAEAVSKGRFKKVSASFYQPDSPHNPVPGVYYLRHVGFLGAQPPAVKGLNPVQFADDGGDCVSFEFAEHDIPGILRRMATLFRGLRDYFVEKEGLEKADAIIPSWTMDWLQEDAAVADAETADIPAFQESDMDKNKKPTTLPPAQYGTTEDPRVAELERQLASFSEKSRRADAQTAVDKALADGRLTPGMAVGLVDFMASLDTDTAVSFGEGDNATTATPNAFMTAFLARLPQQVSYGEISKPDHDTIEGLTPQDVAQKALCYQETMRGKGITVTTTDAVAAVISGAAAKEAPNA
ncbi:phage protease [Desulfovibrio sp.]|uniref:phage protease n=1 Tax=Desulfovibrio sp. TaxID=885 RepID=UPI003D1518F0